MAEQPIRFDDGAAYERMMGLWSRPAGDVFLDWLAPRPGLKWVDVGCGNGAFTELIVGKSAPAEVHGIDPSEGQIKYARERPGVRTVEFQQGDAMQLPFPDRSFDAATMALVIFFVPDPAKGVAEMVRVVSPGGIVAAYAWDMHGGGFPLEPLLIEIRALGLSTPRPPNIDASRMEALRDLWTGAGLDAIETREITVQRAFDDFDDFWTSCLKGPTIAATIAAMAADDVALLKTKVRARVPADAGGRITCDGRANAIKGTRARLVEWIGHSLPDKSRNIRT